MEVKLLLKFELSIFADSNNGNLAVLASCNKFITSSSDCCDSSSMGFDLTDNSAVSAVNLYKTIISSSVAPAFVIESHTVEG